MKILQLTNKMPYPPKDGGAIATLNISTGLSEQGHQVTLLGMNTSKHYTPLDAMPATLRNQVKFHDVPINTDLSFTDAVFNLLFSSLPYNAVRFFRKEFAHKLESLLKNNAYDVIQLEGLYMAWYIPLIRKHSRALISLRAHNIENEIWGRTAEQEKSFFRKIYFGILARRIKRFKLQIINTYDVLIPITGRDGAYFKAVGNTKPTRVIPAGFDMAKMQAQPDSVRFPNVFFIGTLDWFPNQEGLVWFMENVWQKLLQECPDITLHVAGRNAPPWIEKLLYAAENVKYYGEIDDAQAFINENAVMIVPLFSGSGMRVKIIEGMALGKSIVTTSIGAEGIPVSSGHNIIIVDDAQQFASEIARLVNDRDFFEQLGKNAAMFVREKFDNRHITSELARFYETQIADRG